MHDSEELAWLMEKAQDSLCETKNVLTECHSAFMSPVRLPLTVSCKDVFRGVLVRSGAYANITLHVKLHRTHFTIQNESFVLTQASILLKCIRQAILLVSKKQSDGEGMLTTVMQTVHLLEVGLNVMPEPEPQFKFPHRKWIPPGIPQGYCSEIIIDGGDTILFSLLAYHDGGAITSATSSRSPDPKLAESIETLRHVVDDLKLLERNLTLCMSTSNDIESQVK